MTHNTGHDDTVQHGIDDDAHNDGKKALGLGAVLGGVVGALAGGPVGAVVGGTIGSLMSGAAVDAVDKVDNDDTISGLGSDTTPGASTRDASMENDASTKTGATGAYPTATGAYQDKTSDYAQSTPMTNNTPQTPTTRQTPASTSVTPAGFNPDIHGTYTSGNEQRPVTRDQYDAMDETDRLKVQLLEEQLNVQKDVRQAGEVTVSKHVVEEQVSVPVTLQHEEVTVTRHKVDQPVDATTVQGGTIFQDQTIKVPVHEEVANVTKSARVAEEVEIDKHAVTEQRTVSDTVRREELDINTPNNVRVDEAGR